MHIFSLLLLLCFTLVLCAFTAFATSGALAGSKVNRVMCGNYSFVLPENFELQVVKEESGVFGKELLLSTPYKASSEHKAVVTCLLEKKTEYRDLVLPRKEAIKLVTVPRQSLPINITAADDLNRQGIQARYAILEEKKGNDREVRGMYYYIPVLEMMASDDDYHTIIFFNDYREDDEFFNMEEYRSKVNRTAAQVWHTIKKTAP